MSTFSWFYGVSIRMVVDDHPPPHFHADYESSAARIATETGEVRVGRPPPRIARLVESWRVEYAEELRAAWAIAERGDTTALGRIPGLDRPL